MPPATVPIPLLRFLQHPLHKWTFASAIRDFGIQVRREKGRKSRREREKKTPSIRSVPNDPLHEQNQYGQRRPDFETVGKNQETGCQLKQRQRSLNAQNFFLPLQDACEGSPPTANVSVAHGADFVDRWVNIASMQTINVWRSVC